MDYVLSLLVCLLSALLALYVYGALQAIWPRFKLSPGTKPTPKTNPPGPFPLPIFGNLFQLGTKPHVSMAKLAKMYGPITTLHLGQLQTVIISSPEVAREALQKKDVSFANRTIPDAFSVSNPHESSRIAWLPLSPHWRTLRKLCNSYAFSKTRLDARGGLRREKVEELVSNIEACSRAGVAVDIGYAAFVANLNMMSRAFFSVDLVDNDSEFTREFKDIVNGVMDEAGKRNLADFFPALKRMDPQGIRRRTETHLKKMAHIFNAMIKQRLEGSKRASSGSVDDDSDVLDALLGLGIKQDSPKYQIEMSQIPHLLVDLFAAGADTTPKNTEWAIAELLRNPEKLQKAQAELHKVIGEENPVETIEKEISRLPYLQAVVKETIRLHPTVPFLVPRKVLADTELCGFTVPKNAQVLINAWAIGRDPGYWENPDSFEPERFLGKRIDVKGNDFELIPFGAGRRMCPGTPMAMRMLHLMVGSLIHRFDWRFEHGITHETMDMEEKASFTLSKAQPLRAIPLSRKHG